MTLIVEDGSVIAGAESYVSVTDADTYHSNRGNTAWAALTTAEKEVALRKATDYMVQVYRKRWSGYRKDTSQELDWPRSFVYLVSDAIVPKEVKNSCAELALKASTSTLLADTTQQVLSETVGPVSIDYDKFSGQDTRYASVDAMLSIYFTGSQNTIVAVRK